MRPQIPIPVKMDQMARRVGNPDFGFPSDVGQIARHDGAGRKGGHIDQSAGCAAE